MTLEIIILAIIAYFIGSIPTGIIVAKILGAPDPRTVGSGNIGATNVGRAGGKAAGIITLVGDVLKGFLIILLAFYIFGSSPKEISIMGLAVFLGHIFPVFLKFKGGKGVATALGVFLAIGPLPAMAALILFVILVAIFRYISVGSMIAAASIPVFFSFFTSSQPYVPLAAVIAVFIILKHSDNIKRLIQGTENKIGR
ncbi:MAG: glycerol-3-phosphate 1-O-acyltransferase PlsY [Deltaproteobacteria bacterium]|nr:glycerol-3-phosphate 1-O-acyltransferase PlsY [Deltaproteobacteria bacterium]